MCLNEVHRICRASNNLNANSLRFMLFKCSDERGKVLPFDGFILRVLTGHEMPVIPPAPAAATSARAAGTWQGPPARWGHGDRECPFPEHGHPRLAWP